MKYHFAQLNIAPLSLPYEHPALADFVNSIDRINEIADNSKGFVWRYSELVNTDTVAIFGENMLVNMSVWTGKKALQAFTYHSPHVEIYKRRKEWFKKTDGPHMVCWYVPEDHKPTLSEAHERLLFLAENGESPWAFTFRSHYTPEEAASYQPDKISKL